MTKAFLFILERLFKWLFKANKEVLDDAQQDFYKAGKALLGLSGRQIREFLAAVPMFLIFVKRLVERRDEFGNTESLVILGAGGALTALPVIWIVSVLGSLPFQIAFLLAHPALGIPLFLSTQLFMWTAAVFLIWIIIFVLNKAFSDDPTFQEIRDKFVPAKERAVLYTIEKTVRDSGAEAGQLTDIVSKGLMERGRHVSPEKLGDRLDWLGVQVGRRFPDEIDSPTREKKDKRWAQTSEKLRDALEQDPPKNMDEGESTKGASSPDAEHIEALKKKMRERSKGGRTH